MRYKPLLMKTRLLPFLCTLMIVTSSFRNIDDEELRSLYWEAATSKDAAGQLLKLLAPVNEQSEPLLVCYKGAAEMFQAKYLFNPISKLNRFQKGKVLIETAIRRDPEHLEMRFLRFSIQSNLPSFLGYNECIENDKQMLLKNIHELEDLTFKQNVIRYLVSSKHCTKEELKILGK